MESAIGKLRSAQPSLTSGLCHSLPPTWAAKAPDTVLFLVLAARALKRCRAPSKNSALCWVRHKGRGPPKAASFCEIGARSLEQSSDPEGDCSAEAKDHCQRWDLGRRHSADPKKSTQVRAISNSYGIWRFGPGCMLTPDETQVLTVELIVGPAASSRVPLSFERNDQL